MAYKDRDGSGEAKNKPAPSVSDSGRNISARNAGKLGFQDLTVLERTIRGRVSGLIGSKHPDLIQETDKDLRLSPELNARALQLPGAENAIGFRDLFMKALVTPDPRPHREVVDELLQSGIPLQTLAVMLFFPVATRLGYYWCNDETDFMDIAVASTRLAHIVNHLTLSSQQDRPAPRSRRILLARSRDTQHTLGVTLVRLCFRDLGWIVDGGADMEIGDTLYSQLTLNHYDMVGLSIGHLAEVPDCRETIIRSRNCLGAKTTKIAVGGRAVLDEPSAFDEIGADYIASSVLSVFQLSDQVSVKY
ncbi:cobalamin-binding protein [Roseibium denhamense]|uniref:cobalamin B12-binding domain-containing protein n=1 Tax=Roseibium denhamense TaxID=76305 RepID=UPI0012BCAC91|nr:cobalamin-binding protein [Roseibium denhamense]MTI03990.1 cobalamin-binding protein [Roseibium denhamense]